MIALHRSTVLADVASERRAYAIEREVARETGYSRALGDVLKHPARYAGALAVAILTVPVAKAVAVGAIGRFVIFGVAGWAIEAIHSGRPRYSAALGGARVGAPFLPVYAVGGSIVTAVAPPLAAVLPIGRGVVYAIALSGVEWVACRIDRASGHRSWDYEREAQPPSGRTLARSDARQADDRGCVDAVHAIAWGVLGRIAERAVL